MRRPSGSSQCAKPRGGAIELLGPLDLEPHQAEKGVVHRTGRQFLFRVAAAAQIGQRQIDAAGGGVFLQVAEDVGQLQGDARLPGRLERLGPAKAPDMNARQPHGRRHALAVSLQFVESLVTSRRQIHLDAVDHRQKVFVGDVETANGVGQGGKEGGRRKNV